MSIINYYVLFAFIYVYFSHLYVIIKIYHYFRYLYTVQQMLGMEAELVLDKYFECGRATPSQLIIATCCTQAITAAPGRGSAAGIKDILRYICLGRKPFNS